MTCVLTLLSPPPSLNGAFRNVPGKGRVKTKAYKGWRRDAEWQVSVQKPPHFTGPVAVSIALPMSTRGDVDNRAKAAMDLLQSAGVVANDRQCDPVTIGRADVALTTITITPRAAE